MTRPGKIPSQAGSNPGSSALEADTLTTRPLRRLRGEGAAAAVTVAAVVVVLITVLVVVLLCICCSCGTTDTTRTVHLGTPSKYEQVTHLSPVGMVPAPSCIVPFSPLGRQGQAEVETSWHYVFGLHTTKY